MEDMIVPIMKEVRSYLKRMQKNYLQKIEEKTKEMPTQFHDMIAIVYLLCKVRHHKYINKFFPHEVSDLEPVTFYLIE